MVLVTQGLKLSFFLKGQLVTNNGKISDARPLILVTIFMRYISCLTRKTKAKKILIMLLSKNGTSWSVFITISLVIRNADSWGRNHSLVFITSEIRVLYCSLHIFALNFWLQWWQVYGNFKALLLQPDLVSNGESPNFIQAGIRLSLEDFTINIGNGDQTTPGRAQKWLFLFSFLQKFPVEKELSIFLFWHHLQTKVIDRYRTLG